ncbi:MAG: Flp pilus assembly protein CpaB [Bdellovibrionales bacterium]
MGQRQIIFLALAAFVGIGMVLLARGLMSSPETESQAESSIATTRVLVATKNIPAGNFVGAADVEWRSWPSDSPVDGLFAEGSATNKDYIGAVAREGIRAGEPLLRARVMKPSEGGFLSAVLGPGMRAMTIKVSPTSGVAGLIFPNDRVDVILAQKISNESDDGSSGERRVSETVLENVRVLALDQKLDDQKKEAKIAELATLEVTSKQAEKLAVASQMGALSLVLRSVANEIPVEVTDAATGTTATTNVPQVSALPLTMDNEVSKVHRVQIIRGSSATEVVVPGSR